MEQSTNTAVSTIQLPGTFALTTGKKVTHVELETAFVVGGKQAATFIKHHGIQSAITKAKNGYYKAAAEIIGFAADAATKKFCAPAEGQAWKKGAIIMLAEKTLERPSGAKGYTGKQIEGRRMARMVLDALGVQVQPFGDVVGEAHETTADEDSLAGVGEAPL